MGADRKKLRRAELHRQARQGREGEARDSAGERCCCADQGDEGNRDADEQAQDCLLYTSDAADE